MSNKRWEPIASWLRAAQGKPLALVLGGSVNGLSFVRSLARRGVPTLLLETDSLIGTYTRYGRAVFLPDAGENPGDWIEFFQFVGSRIDQAGVLFATSDLHNVLVAEHASLLRRHFRFLVPAANTMEQIVNKRLQYGIAASAGIAIPKSFFPQSLAETERTAAAIAYPCILKPYKAHIGRKKLIKKVALIESPEQLIAEYQRLTSDGVEFMIQEIVPGGDSALYGYLAFWDAEGRERAWLTKRKLRQSSRFGDGSLQITVEAPKVAELSRRLLMAFNYCGFVGVEFKYDARDGTYRLMEINPRTVSGNQLAISAGVDFPWLGYQYLVGGRIDARSKKPFQVGVQYVNEEWDLKAYRALRKTGELTFRRWLGSLLGSRARAISAWDDPRPLFVLLWRIARAFLRSVLPARSVMPE